MGKLIVQTKFSEDGEAYFDLEVFKDIVDISKVEYYQIKTQKNGNTIVTFYDKKKKVIKPYVK